MTGLEWLAAWGVAQATVFVFRPILEDLAKDCARDIAKSYVAECFKGVFSLFNREPLGLATGRALNELLELMQHELEDAGVNRHELADWVDDVARFIQHESTCEAIRSLFLDPSYQLDPAIFASAWQEVGAEHSLPDDFCWQSVVRRLKWEVSVIRESSEELKETFKSLSSAEADNAIKELAGLPPEFDLETYRIALIERFGKLNFGSLDRTGAYYSGVHLWSIFVPQSVRECREYYPQLLEMPKEHQRRLVAGGELDVAEVDVGEKLLDARRREYFNQLPRPAIQVCDDSSIQTLAFLGDPGSGKSSLLRYLALRWAQIEDPNLRYTQPLPLIIELRDYGRWSCAGARDFTRYLHEAPIWHRLNQQTLAGLLKTPGRVLLLLDGLDEVFDPALRNEVVSDIHRFSKRYPSTRFILTSRVVGYNPRRLHDAGFRHYMLEDLDTEQVDAFLDRWHDVTFDDKIEAAAKRQRLRDAIDGSSAISELAGNPLLLTMMAIVNRHQDLPHHRVELYQQASGVLLHQWDTERALQAYPELRGQVGLREKSDILRRVAHAMQSGPKGLSGNFIAGDELIRLIEEYLREELHFDQSRAAAHAVVNQLRERNFILCFLGADSYAFVHRTFLEYFCALEFVHQFNIRHSLDFAGLLALFETHCCDYDWREVLLLVCAQIDDMHIAQLAERLASKTRLENWDCKSPLPELELAIRCLSEVRNLPKQERACSNIMEEIIQFVTRARAYYDPEQQFVRFLNYNLIPALSQIGVRWPANSAVAECALTQIGKLDWYCRSAWTALVAAVVEGPELIRSLAVWSPLRQDRDQVRGTALRILAERWPTESTRAFLIQRVAEDIDENVRSAAVSVLAEKWRDEGTRDTVLKWTRMGTHSMERWSAIQALVENWPHQGTRELFLTQMTKYPDDGAFLSAMSKLAEKFRDDEMRDFVTKWATSNKRGNDYALGTLTDNWPDDRSRAVVMEIIAGGGDLESTALFRLGLHWPDDESRSLLTSKAINHADENVRRVALDRLADCWPDNETRELLTSRETVEVGSCVRNEIWHKLGHFWPDESTRSLIVNRMLNDPEEEIRTNALTAFACYWKNDDAQNLVFSWIEEHADGSITAHGLFSLAGSWPNRRMRRFLKSLAAESEEKRVRINANDALAWYWPYQQTEDFLRWRAMDDVDREARCQATSLLGGFHSEFGRVLPLAYNSSVVYLDPREPISRENIMRAAERVGLRPEAIDTTVESLNSHLGWDIRLGCVKGRLAKRES